MAARKGRHFFVQLTAAEIVGALHYYGFSVLVFTIDNQLEWMFMSEAGVDGMYIDDIPMGLMMEGY